MSAERKYYNNYYDGSAARQFDAVPDYERTRREQREEFERRQTERNKKARRRAQRSRGIDLFSVFMLTIALGAMMFVTVTYVQAQVEETRLDKRIASLQSKVISMTDENAAIKESTVKDLDLNKVYEIATTSLGMVHPMQNQVITYESSKNEYVKQYDSIPETDATSISDVLLGK